MKIESHCLMSLGQDFFCFEKVSWARWKHQIRSSHLFL